jgi:starch synthase
LIISQAASAEGKQKRTTVSELKARVDELQEENTALRAALAAIRGYDGASVDYETDDEDSFPLGPSPTIRKIKRSKTRPEDGMLSDEEAGAMAVVATPMQFSALASMDEVVDSLESGIVWPQPGESNPPFYNRAPRSAPLQVPSDTMDSENAAGSFETSANPVKIVHITAEMAPCAKVGGLGDVVTGLSKACLAQGHSAEVILPYYQCIPDSAVENLQFDRAFDCPKGKFQDNTMHMSNLKTLAYTGTIEGVPVVLLRPDWESTGSGIFKGTRIYGGSYNEAEAYLYFCRAALEYLVHSGRRPDIIHAHEWQASAVPMLFWDYFSNALPGARPALTIHNMDNSGECRQDEFAATGISGEVFADVEKALDERTIGHNPERLCLLKGGIVYSSVVTTVSPTYAMETMTGGAAGWLRSTLSRPEVGDKYWGVLNGIDTEMWNPATDALIPACFSSAVPDGKALCKRFLQQGFGMDVSPDKPLVAVISRLVPQKGIHLIEHSVGRTVSQGGQFVLLGTGHASGGLQRLNEEYRGTGVSMVFDYSDQLAHLIYAAADIFLVPSMFEPCGLTQMIALRYGGVPVVRSTGGLADTVFDVDADRVHGNGFVFEGSDAGSLEGALDRALNMYHERKDEWAALCGRNLSQGERWSWKAPAQSYVGLYRGALEKR